MNPFALLRRPPLLVGLHLKSVPVLLVSLFLMGMHSTIFGPVKYSILPQHLSEAELVGGNERAFDEIARALADGDVVCIFPEGRLTSTGDMGRFRPGIERIIQRSPVPVVPLALRGQRRARAGGAPCSRSRLRP